MDLSSDEYLTTLFLTLSDLTRLRLLRIIGNKEASVGYLADQLGESQPKVSRHLAFLRENGVVGTRRDGKNVFYSLCTPGSPITSVVLNAVIGVRTDGIDPVRDREGGGGRTTSENQATHIGQDIYDRDDDLPIYLL